MTTIVIGDAEPLAVLALRAAEVVYQRLQTVYGSREKWPSESAGRALYYGLVDLGQALRAAPGLVVVLPPKNGAAPTAEVERLETGPTEQGDE